VGHEHAHGGILGVAVAVPRNLQAADRARLLRALAALRREGLKLGALGRWDLDRPEEGASRVALRDRAWTAVPAGARQWATVTPYVFDRHAKAKDKGAYQRELADAVRGSWERVQHSSNVSVEVIITPVSAHLGTPASHQFPRLARKDGSECRHTHAILIFDRPVVGPVLLGAGRYRGYGLCRPLETEG
jgi:CRISPR-associated protein Csb2